jgi:malonate decarboxylase epsilon subunit
MLAALPDAPPVRDALAQASDTLALDVRSLDDAASLRSTVATQLCLLVAGVASARHLESESGPPDAVAGFSVGAFAAAVTAKALEFPEALRLVEQRARLMEQAYPDGHGMLAVLGLPQARVQALVDRMHTAAAPVFLANINAPAQLVVAGADAALAAVADAALASGAAGAQRIAMGVPSHCPLLDEAAARLAAAAAGVTWAASRLRYYSATLAREVRDGPGIGRDLVDNMARPVQWHETTVLAREHGVRLMIEMPPGGVLTRLAIAAHEDVVSLAADETRADSIAVLMQRERQRRQ